MGQDKNFKMSQVATVYWDSTGANGNIINFRVRMEFVFH